MLIFVEGIGAEMLTFAKVSDEKRGNDLKITDAAPAFDGELSL